MQRLSRLYWRAVDPVARQPEFPAYQREAKSPHADARQDRWRNRHGRRAQPRARGEQLLAGARNGLDHFNACDSRAGPRRVHGAITRAGDGQNTLPAPPSTSKKPYPGCRLRKARTADGRRVMGQIGILRAPALVSRARGASQPSVAAERFLMITLPGCLWCKRPFRARRGGSPKRFCCAAHRIAFWSAARRWAERAVVSGLLSVDDIRNDPTEACTLLPGASSPEPVSLPQQPGAAAPEEAIELPDDS